MGSVFEKVHPILYFHLKWHNTVRTQTLTFRLLKSYGPNSDIYLNATRLQTINIQCMVPRLVFNWDLSNGNVYFYDKLDLLYSKEKTIVR